MKKTIFITLFIFLNVILACNKEETCGPVNPYFRIKSIHALNRVQHTDTIDVSEYIVNIQFKSDYYTHSTQKNTHGGMLYALSCNEPGGKGAKEGFRNLHVITLRDYNDSYRANDTISNALHFSDLITNSLSDFVSKAEFIKNKENSLIYQEFAFRIVEEMEHETQTAQFKIIIELTNGDVFESTTEPVLIRRK